MFLKPFLELLRIKNCLIASFGVFIGYAVALHAFSVNAYILLAMVSAFLICGAGQSINDFFDLNVDRRKNIKKPMIKYNLNPRVVLIFSISLFLIGSLISFYLGLVPFMIAATFSLLLLIYSTFLSKVKCLGNWLVALSTAFTLLFGASLIGNYSIVLWFALLALFANVYRELVKDIEDLDADKGFKKTLPMLIGIKKAKYFAALILFVALVFSYIPLVSTKINYYYAFVVTLAVMIFLYSLLLLKKNNFHKAQFYSKAAMFVGLLAFLASVI